MFILGYSILSVLALFLLHELQLGYLKLYTIVKEVYSILIVAYCGLFRFDILCCRFNALFNKGYTLFDSFSFL